MNMDEEEKHRATLSIDLDWSQMTVSVDGRGGHTAGLFIQRISGDILPGLQGLNESFHPPHKTLLITMQ